MLCMRARGYMSFLVKKYSAGAETFLTSNRAFKPMLAVRISAVCRP